MLLIGRACVVVVVVVARARGREREKRIDDAIIHKAADCLCVGAVAWRCRPA